MGLCQNWHSPFFIIRVKPFRNIRNNGKISKTFKVMKKFVSFKQKYYLCKKKELIYYCKDNCIHENR